MGAHAGVLQRQPAEVAIPASSLPAITDRSLSELAVELQYAGAPAYRARQIVAGVHGRHVRSWDQLTDIPRVLRAQLASTYRVTALELRAEQGANDGTVKLLFSTWDGQLIETVQIPAGESRRADQHSRLTVCVSSQAGCALACTFCATGQMGLARNLTVGEIVEQVYLAERPGEPRRVDNIVFMGMGEPLANPAAVIGAVRVMADPAGYGFSPRRITISTSGLVPQMRRLAEQDLPVRLAVSLHAPNDELRSRLMPINRRYPIAQVLDAARAYAERSGRRVSYEYVMLDGINDALERAEQLAELLRGDLAHVNLIPYNETGADYRATPPERIYAFARALRARGIACSIRASRGRDIAAACGQLKAENARPAGTIPLTA
jgi:23S rRNA (adenine2503-C2)-methyltransferase